MSWKPLQENAGAMIIVAGSHGLSGFEEYWIGE